MNTKIVVGLVSLAFVLGDQNATRHANRRHRRNQQKLLQIIEVQQMKLDSLTTAISDIANKEDPYEAGRKYAEANQFIEIIENNI